MVGINDEILQNSYLKQEEFEINLKQNRNNNNNNNNFDES